MVSVTANQQAGTVCTMIMVLRVGIKALFPRDSAPGAEHPQVFPSSCLLEPVSSACRWELRLREGRVWAKAAQSLAETELTPTLLVRELLILHSS